MRHAVFGRRLGRDTNQRQALLNNLASSLLISGQVTTTQAKAKFVRPYVEKLITYSQKDKLYLRRILSSRLAPGAFTKLITEIGPGFTQRSGGYTRIIKLGTRRGDNAPLARIELLSYEKPKDKKRVTASVTKKPTKQKKPKPGKLQPARSMAKIKKENP